MSSVQEDVTLAAHLEAVDDASAVVEDVKGAFEDVGTAIQNMDDATTTAGAEGSDSMGLLSNALVGVADVAGQVFDIVERIATIIGVVGVTLDVIFLEAVNSARDYAGQLTVVRFLTGETSQESAALIAGFEGVGISTQGAVSMLTRLSANLGALATAQHAHGRISASQALEMKNLGISFLNAQGDMLPMTQLMPVIIDHLKNMTNVTERDRLARTLFGRSFADLAPLIEAGGAAFVKASGDAALFGNNLSQDQVDALNKYKAAQQQVKEALDGFTGVMAEKALPLLMAFENGIKAVYLAYQALSPGTKQAIQDALVLVATLGTLGGGALALGHGLSTIARFLGPLAPAAERLAPAILAVAGPFALVAAAAIGLYLAYQHVTAVHQALEPYVRTMQAAFNSLHAAIAYGLDIWKQTHDPLLAVQMAFIKLGVPMDIVTLAGRFLTGVFNQLRTAVQEIAAQVLPALRDAWNDLQPSFKQIWDTLVQMKPVWEVIGVLLIAVGAIIFSLLGGVFHALVEFLKYGLPTAITFVVNVIKMFADSFKLMGDFVMGIIGLLDDAVHGRWAKLWTDAQKFVMTMVHDVQNLFGDLFNTIFSLIGGAAITIIMTINGLVTGFINAFLWLKDQLVGHSIIPDMIHDIVNWFGSLPGQVLGIIGGLAASAVTAAKNLGTSIVNGIRAGLSGMDYLLKHAMKAMLENIPLGGGAAAISALGLQGYALGTMAGPSFGGAKVGIFGEGQDEVVANATQMARVGANLSGGGGSAKGDITIILQLDSNVLTRAVMKNAAGTFRLKGGNQGSSA